VTQEPRRLYDALVAFADREPEAPAFTFLGANPSRYSFGGVAARADRLGARLAEALPPGSLVGILLRTQEDQTLHYLAALRAGLVPAVLTPPNRKLNPRYYAQTTSAVLRRSAFAGVVTDVEELELATRTFSPFTFEPTAEPRELQQPVAATDVALLQFSSGTTGMKRGVPLRCSQVLTQIEAYGDAIALSPSDVIVSWLPLYHDMGFMACLNMPLARGIHTVVLDPIDWVTRPATFLRAVSEFDGTLAWNPNFAYAFMAERVRDEDLDEVDLRSVRGLVNCSEPVTHESEQRFLQRFAPHGLRPDVFWGCYAMAETTFALSHGTAADPGAHDAEGPTGATRLRSEVQVSVGRPLPGVHLTVTDDAGRPLPDRHVGELRVRSPFNFDGYYNDAEATALAHRADWYLTGDLGYAVGESFFVTGRKKDVLIVGGVNVFPQDLEAAVSELDGVVPGRVSASSEFDPAVQSERITILFESALEGAELRRLVVAARQKVLAAFQIANFDIHPVEPGWLVKSTSGKMARAENHRQWTTRPNTTGAGT
jgi:fatty-acyl-CoA synthase